MYISENLCGVTSDMVGTKLQISIVGRKRLILK